LCVYVLVTEDKQEDTHMADIDINPRIKCDKCGHEVDKQASTNTNGKLGGFRPPSGWGTAYVGGLYAGIEISLSDLCPECVIIAVDSLSTFTND
jgi:hypothetical protein